MNNTEKLIVEARKDGQEYIRSQMEIALASDQRAVALGGIFAAAAAVVLGLDVIKVGDTMSAAAATLVFGLTVASAFAFYSARPLDFDPPGNTPSQWRDDIAKNVPVIQAFLEDMAHIDACIKSNNAVLKGNGEKLKQSMVIALGSLAFSGIIMIVSAFKTLATT